LQRAATLAPIARSLAGLAVHSIGAQLGQPEKMSDDAKFILGFG
jgi:hypothetical protein